MGKEVKVEVQEAEASEESRFYQLARKVLLAGLGAVAMTQEEMERFVAKLVERGELAEQDGKKLVRDVVEKRKKQTQKAEDELDSRLKEVLDRMNVPTKSDIDALSAKITALTKKVDELKKG